MRPGSSERVDAWLRDAEERHLAALRFADVRRALQARDLSHATLVYGYILKYAKLFPEREMGVMLVTDLHRSIGKPLFGVPEFAEWASSITDLMLYDLKLSSPP